MSAHALEFVLSGRRWLEPFQLLFKRRNCHRLSSAICAVIFEAFKRAPLRARRLCGALRRVPGFLEDAETILVYREMLPWRNDNRGQFRINHRGALDDVAWQQHLERINGRLGEFAQFRPIGRPGSRHCMSRVWLA